MVKFVVLGSSYVEWLRRFMFEDLKVFGEVRWFGVLGLCCDLLIEEMWRCILIYKLDCLFFYVWGNDIIIIISLNDVVRKIMDIYCNFKDFGVKSVFVVEVLIRGDFSWFFDKDLIKVIFDKKRKKINIFLKS